MLAIHGGVLARWIARGASWTPTLEIGRAALPMNLYDAAVMAESFLRGWLARHGGEEGDEAFATVIRKVEPDGDDGLHATFGVSIPFRMGDMRPQRHIHAALCALLEAHPEFETLRIEVTANTMITSGRRSQRRAGEEYLTDDGLEKHAMGSPPCDSAPSWKRS